MHVKQKWRASLKTFLRNLPNSNTVTLRHSSQLNISDKTTLHQKEHDQSITKTNENDGIMESERESKVFLCPSRHAQTLKEQLLFRCKYE